MNFIGSGYLPHLSWHVRLLPNLAIGNGGPLLMREGLNKGEFVFQSVTTEPSTLKNTLYEGFSLADARVVL